MQIVLRRPPPGAPKATPTRRYEWDLPDFIHRVDEGAWQDGVAIQTQWPQGIIGKQVVQLVFGYARFNNKLIKMQ